MVVRISRTAARCGSAAHAVGTRDDASPTRCVAPREGMLTVRVRLTGPDGGRLARRPALRVGRAPPDRRTRRPRDARVRFLQRRLAALRYAIAVTGRFDDATRARGHRVPQGEPAQARGQGLARRVLPLARGRGAFRPRHRGAAHVEGDLTRQVLALVNRGGRVFKVYMTSSGRARPAHARPACTRFWRKSRGWNSSGMLDSAYFTHASGPRTDCAIHGYFVVPIWNASHCCFRVPSPTRARSSTGSASVSGSTCITNLMLPHGSPRLPSPRRARRPAGSGRGPAAAKGPVVELAGAQTSAGSGCCWPASKLALRATAPGAQPGSTRRHHVDRRTAGGRAGRPSRWPTGARSSTP